MPRGSAGWTTMGLWVAITVLGWAIEWAPWPRGNTMLNQIAVSSGMDPTPWPIYLISGAFTGAVQGIILGTGQWFVLRRRLKRAGSWIMQSALGMAAGWSAGTFLGIVGIALFRSAHGWELGDRFEYPLVAEMAVQSAALRLAPVGLALGLFQWWSQRHWVEHSWWWIIVSAIIWPLAGIAYWLVYGLLGGPFCQSWSCLFEEHGFGYYPASVVGWLLGGAIVGLVSASAMNHLLTSHKKQEQVQPPLPKKTEDEVLMYIF